MKKMTAILLCLALALFGAAALAEDGKTSLGTIALNGSLELRCALPEGYSVGEVDAGAESGNFTARIHSDDPTKPVMMLSIAFEELMSEIGRLNDLNEDALRQIEQTFRAEDEVDITYAQTAHGTKLMVVKEVRDAVDYVDFYTIYQGYEIEFVLVKGESAESPLSDAQIQMAVDFLSGLDFVTE